MRINLGWLFLETEDLTLPKLLKNLDEGPVPGTELSPEIICKEYGLRLVGETPQSLEIRVHSESHCLHMAQQAFIYQTFTFPSLCELPSSPLKSQTTIPQILFGL